MGNVIPDTLENPASSAVTGEREPPTTWTGILRELGPGIIIAGSVVGSGELIATTAAGAQAGFWLMWIIVVGCVIKVSVQLEVGRYAILSGRTTLSLLGDLPGWRPAGLHWIAWVVLAMLLGGVGQMGGVLGGVGQALGIAVGVESAVVIGVAAALVALLTVAILWPGRYQTLERLMIVLVAAFTVISLGNLVMLQFQPKWAITWSDLGRGMSFRLPPGLEWSAALKTALAAFGIIGMAAGEIVFYPYWCLRKGYGRYTGACDDSAAWHRRAAGWVRVMRWDAYGSMLVYTVSTIAFYLMGAAILARSGLEPQGMALIRTLMEMYQPVFGEWAVGLFVWGACAVLYSTFLVNNASSALVWADAITLVRGAAHEKRRASWERRLCVALPLGALTMYLILPDPRGWVIFAGISQTLTLPLLGFAAVRLRFMPATRRFAHRRWGDVFLIVTACLLAAAAVALLAVL